MDTIDGMRVFAAVAAEGSFTAGARRLRISTKLASKYVRQLEERLGAQLFNRTTRSVALTDTGAAYHARCLSLLDAFDDLEATVQERQRTLAGTIRVTAPTGFGVSHLTPALGSFMTAHDGVEIDLDLTDRRVALVEEGFDLAIRIGPLRDSALVVRRLAPMAVVVVAAPAYLARRGRPRDPQELAGHDCILDRGLRDAGWRFGLDGAEQTVRVSGRFLTNAPAAAAAMALAGQGIAAAPLYTVEPALADGRLVVLFERSTAVEFGVHALYPANRHLTARVRALIDHLARSFAAREWGRARPEPA